MGAKKRPFFRLVVADARSPRDGRFIEQLGIYDPLATPATIRIDGEKVKAWLGKGAQPSDAARSLLQREGILDSPAFRHPKAVNVGAVPKAPKPAAKKLADAEVSPPQGGGAPADEVSPPRSGEVPEPGEGEGGEEQATAGATAEAEAAAATEGPEADEEGEEV